MTKVRFRFRNPDGMLEDGLPSKGILLFSPTSRIVNADKSIFLPLSFVTRMPEDGSDLIVSLQPTGKDWCWHVREQFEDYIHVRNIIVPDSVQTLDYATLGEVEWTPSNSEPVLVHGIRVYNGIITMNDHISTDALKPSDNVNIGDTCIDSTGQIWMITALVDSDAVFGIDTGVRLAGNSGPQGLSFRSGKGEPTDLTQGNIGDTYLDLDTGNVYILQM